MVKIGAFLVAMFMGATAGFVLAAIGSTVYSEFLASEPGAADEAFSNFTGYGLKGAVVGAVLGALAMVRQLRKSPEKVAGMMAQGGSPRPERNDTLTPPTQL